MKKSKLFIILAITGLSLFFTLNNVSAAVGIIEEKTQDISVSQRADTVVSGKLDSNDAIGVRIIPNPEHYSITRWYENRGFTGAPQVLTVDGYEAIRDGRTVYVNAANVKGKEIFTNVYLISYNQDPSIKTIDILGQIVKNWKFNTDLNENVSPAPSCRISLASCEKDADCPSNQFCLLNDSSNGYISESHTCRLKVEKNCLTDSDCPQNFFCNSVKAKIIRDIKRISKTEEIKQALYNYKKENGYYPKLESGSYLSGQSVSVWPSWNDTFLSEISLSKSFIDPINNLGYCPGFDLKTCWNKDTKRFYNSTNGSLVLPPASFAFIYKSDNNGLNFNLCSTMETKEPTADLNFQFSPATAANSNCVVATGVISGSSVANTAPRLVNAYLFAETNQEFIGALEVVDDQKNALTWDIKSSVNWEQAGWSGAPILKNGSNANQRKMYAAKAGKPGSYPVTLSVNDGQGGTLTTTTKITVINPKSFIEAENIEYTLNPTIPFTYTFYVTNQNLADYLTAITLTKVSGSGSFDLLSLVKTISPVGTGRYKITYSGIISTANKLYGSASYTYRISVKDKFNEVTSKDFKVIINSESPALNFTCPSVNRSSNSYSCLLGSLKQSDQTIVYSNNNLNFAGLKIVNSGNNALLNSASTILDSSHSSSTINIKATNQYGASTTKSFKLEIQSFCGDGIKQNPNSEGRGGIYNNGQEDCDGNQGVALTAASSSEMAQYACATFSRNTPNPITNNNYCVFKSPVDGGGFCGDTYCQVEKENKDNCPQDCMSICVPNCSRLGNDCGDNGCGGSCGDCAIGDECFGGKCCLNEANFKVYSGNGPTSVRVYFNNKEISNDKVYSFSEKISHGKNVLAVQSTKSNDKDLSSIGTAIKQISQVVDKNQNPKNICRDVTTSNLKNWKCRNYIDSNGSVIASSWYTLDYNDSAWSAPNSGYRSPYATIWAKDYDSSYNPLSVTYCRYTFIGDATSTETCVPDSSTKECGSNGCGGNFRPDNCAAANKKNTNFYCSDGKCACDKLTCNNGINYGLEGSLCGVIDDKCNGTIDCAYNCADGLYCKMKTEAEFTKYGKGADYEFVTRSCNAGKPDNTCQKKCWYKTFALSMEMRQGDTPETTLCKLRSAVDNPKCSDNPNPACPSSCSVKKVVSSVSLSNGKADRCWNKQFLWGCWGLCKYDWQERTKWICSSGDTTKKTFYYNDVCNDTLNYKVDKTGECGPCLPNCVGKACGADNSCGGKCNLGACGSGEACLGGTCKTCTPDCTNKGCGESDGCNGTCNIYDSCGYDSDELYNVCKNSVCEVCVPNCSGKACGSSDGCKGVCMTGTCTNGQVCQSGVCKTTCTPSCAGKTCGADDGCGNKCSTGTCPIGETCKSGRCFTTMSPEVSS